MLVKLTPGGGGGTGGLKEVLVKPSQITKESKQIISLYDTYMWGSESHLMWSLAIFDHMNQIKIITDYLY